MSTITLVTAVSSTYKGITASLKSEVSLTREGVTVRDIFDTFTDVQKEFSYFVLGETLQTGGEYRMIDAEFDTRQIPFLNRLTARDFIKSLSKKQHEVLHFLMNKAAEEL